MILQLAYTFCLSVSAGWRSCAENAFKVEQLNILQHVAG
jgi:hypothetical protein